MQKYRMMRDFSFSTWLFPTPPKRQMETAAILVKK